MGVDDLPAVRLNAATDAVLAVLRAAPGAKLSTAEVTAAARVPPGAARRALAALGAARLVQHMVQDALPDRPPHKVWWLTRAGRVLAGRRAAAPPG